MKYVLRLGLIIIRWTITDLKSHTSTQCGVVEKAPNQKPLPVWVALNFVAQFLHLKDTRPLCAHASYISELVLNLNVIIYVRLPETTTKRYTNVDHS